MSEEIVDEPPPAGLAPTGPLSLMEWAELFPALPLRTVALSLWEANKTARLHDAEGDRNAVIARLITARLEEFSARRRVVDPDPPT